MKKSITKTDEKHSPLQYFTNNALLPTGWAQNVLITVDQSGWITDIQDNQQCGTAVMLNGPVIPGMLNVHSHAFQRAMAGLAERASGDHDSFWTWRDTMYKFLVKLTPEDQQAIAAQLYVEMLKAGFTTVGEFHYVHHQPDGSPYEDRSLTSQHIIRAAQDAGIGITLLPVLYAYSSFGAQQPMDSQKRFINDEAQILEMISSLMVTYKSDPQVTIGLAHHSLRAVTLQMIELVTRSVHILDPLAPIHIHIAEQLKEVNDCFSWSGRRPVEFLLDNIEVNAQWCLVHATHMTDTETVKLARSGAVVGLCPTTEANLGDGLFNLPNFLRDGGRFGIGSDCHISVSMIEELRLLEYGQRLLRRERAVVKLRDEPSVGTALFKMALLGGAQALGRQAGALEVGKRADFLVLDAESPALIHKQTETLLDALIFAGNVSPIRHVFAGGRQVVNDFKHVAEDRVFASYGKTIKKVYGK